MLAKKISLKVIQAVILSINSYKQDMLSVGNDQKNQKQRQIELLSSYAYATIVGG